MVSDGQTMDATAGNNTARVSKMNPFHPNFGEVFSNPARSAWGVTFDGV